ncbi:MAG: SMP-30/gluconolactonase/LRE family protein [bacterium]
MTPDSHIYDARICDLGEGPFWHPTRHQFFWFDIVGQKLLSNDRDGAKLWRFPEMVSACGWVSNDVLLIAGERDLFLFDLETEEIEVLCDLEADQPGNRSNDGRADPQGGFWIGTMGKDGATRLGKGAIYRYYKGELRKLYPHISIPNGICFTPDGSHGYFADTAQQKVWKVALDPEGWPKADPEVFLDLTGPGLEPDGAVVDADGNYCNAQWGASRVAVYSPAGDYLREIRFAAPHTSCPAFGGPDLATLFCTTALEGMSPEARAAAPDAGKTFAASGAGHGRPEPRVLLE